MSMSTPKLVQVRILRVGGDITLHGMSPDTWHRDCLALMNDWSADHPTHAPSCPRTVHRTTPDCPLSNQPAGWESTQLVNNQFKCACGKAVAIVTEIRS